MVRLRSTSNADRGLSVAETHPTTPLPIKIISNIPIQLGKFFPIFLPNLTFMTQPNVSEPTPETATEPTASAKPQPSYIKLAMRNMVRKGGTSLQHFVLTTIALLGLLVGLAYLTR